MPTATTNPERYELLDRIAVGGMAEVFRAKATGAHGFEKMLAIKRILPDLARDPEFEQRFINEAKLAVKLSHANVVQVFDFGRFAGSLFIAMEYVEGLDLAALLKVHRNRDEQVPIPSALYIAIEMARGLDFAHKRSVIHRDVSPSNILLSRAGEVKIADFGIAEAVAKRHHDRKNTGRIMGKWRYMSPEQTRAETLSISSDVFAAAAVMYEVFTREKLFPGDEAEAIIENIHSMEIPSASEQREGLPPRVDEILSRALARDPKSRPSAAEILRELLDISYESTIVASALGVSDAVASVLGAKADDESGDHIGLDDLIRAQLADSEGRAPTIRKTDIGGAPESTAVVTRAVDVDGITILEVDDTLAAGPVAMRGGKRETSPPPFESDSESESEVESVSGEQAVVVTASTTTRITPEPRRRIWPWAMAIAVAASSAGGGAWYLAQRQSRGDIEKLPVLVEDDGGTRDRDIAKLTIDSEPRGAEVRIDGITQPSPTPITLELDTNVEHQVELRLEGYEAVVQTGIKLQPGENLRIIPRLEKLRATLEVRTRPSGALVFIDGKQLGETPLYRSALAPGKARVLTITKRDFRPIERTVDLEVGKPVVLDERLVTSIVYAVVKIRIKESAYGGWADVYLGGKKVGRASGQVRLPVGKQRITLKNTGTGAVKRVTVNVQQGKNRVLQFSLAP